MVAAIPKDTLPIIAEPAARKCRPSNDYDAKFSAQFITAACLLRGRFGLAELTPEALEDPQILALAAKVECIADPDTAFPEYNSGGVSVTTTGGETHREYIRVNLGMGDRVMSEADIVAKYRASARLAFSAAQVARLEQLVLHLEDTSVDVLADAVSGRTA